MVPGSKIHLIRTEDVSRELYRDTLEILQRTGGPLSFPGDPSEISPDDSDIEDLPFNPEVHGWQKEVPPSLMEPDFHVSHNVNREWKPQAPERIKVVKWEKLFAICKDFRRNQGIAAGEQVVLITRLANDLNWFSGSDKDGMNHFIHADQWDMFLPCDPRFPVAYEVTACVLRRLMFDSYRDAESCMHRSPRGCVNDVCKEKKEIILKLRTGDICHDCLERIDQREIPAPVVDQVLRLFESIRTQMLFTERYRSTQRPSRLAVRGRDRRIYFTDLANAELRLTPLEKTLYLLFLKEPDGLQSHELYDHRDWIRETYRTIGNPRTVAEMENSISQLINRTENSASEKISRIKRKIIALTGEDLARHYLIDGPVGGKRRIALDREMVEYG
jgi:hypothetical protein